MNSHNMERVTRLNPTNIPAPVGKYSHVTIIPKNATLYTFSGQIGVLDNGTIPEAFDAQIVQTFANIQQLLITQNLQADEIIKVNIWATEALDWDFLYQQWDLLFGTNYPSMTIAYIYALGLKELKIEIEIWAAKV